MWIVVENVRRHLARICCQLWLLVFMAFISLISVCIIQVLWDLLQLIRCSSTESSLALVFLQTICLWIVGSTLDSYSNNVRWCKTMVVSPLTEARAEIFWMPIARAYETLGRILIIGEAEGSWRTDWEKPRCWDPVIDGRAEASKNLREAATDRPANSYP